MNCKKIFLACVLAVGSAFAVQAQDVFSAGDNQAYLSFGGVKLTNVTGSSNGVMVGYNHSFAFVDDRPAFWRAGVSYRYFFDKSDGQIKSRIVSSLKQTFHEVCVPLSVGYNFQIANNDAFCIAPYAGIDVSCFLSGQIKYDDLDGRIKLSVFDEDDMNLILSETAKRFQLGWHVGTDIMLNQLMFKLSYNRDFTKFYYDEKLSYYSIGLGFVF